MRFVAISTESGHYVAVFETYETKRRFHVRISDDDMRMLSAAAEQETKPRMSLEAQRDALWALLDNIDTLDDSCRENDRAFRDFSRKHLRARFEIYNPEGEKR